MANNKRYSKWEIGRVIALIALLLTILGATINFSYEAGKTNQKVVTNTKNIDDLVVQMNTINTRTYNIDKKVDKALFILERADRETEPETKTCELGDYYDDDKNTWSVKNTHE